MKIETKSIAIEVKAKILAQCLVKGLKSGKESYIFTIFFLNERKFLELFYLYYYDSYFICTILIVLL